MEETEFHGVYLSCTGVDTLHQLTPCGSLFGLDLLACSLKFSMATGWQREENKAKLNDIQSARNTHTHVHRHACIPMCPHMHSQTLVYTHAYSRTLRQPHMHTLMCRDTQMYPKGLKYRSLMGKAEAMGARERHWGNMQGQASALCTPLSANQIQEKHQGWEVREEGGSKPTKHTRAGLLGRGN